MQHGVDDLLERHELGVVAGVAEPQADLLATIDIDAWPRLAFASRCVTRPYRVSSVGLGRTRRECRLSNYGFS